MVGSEIGKTMEEYILKKYWPKIFYQGKIVAVARPVPLSPRTSGDTPVSACRVSYLYRHGETKAIAVYPDVCTYAQAKSL